MFYVNLLFWYRGGWKEADVGKSGEKINFGSMMGKANLWEARTKISRNCTKECEVATATPLEDVGVRGMYSQTGVKTEVSRMRALW